MQSLTSNYDDEAGISSDLLGERCVLQAFTLEIVLKILAFRIDFVKDVWNWFDTFLATWHGLPQHLHSQHGFHTSCDRVYDQIGRAFGTH